MGRAKSGAMRIACGPAARRRKRSAKPRPTMRFSGVARARHRAVREAPSRMRGAGARASAARLARARSGDRCVRHRRRRCRYRACASDQPAGTSGACAARVEYRRICSAGRQRARRAARRTRPARDGPLRRKHRRMDARCRARAIAGSPAVPARADGGVCAFRERLVVAGVAAVAASRVAAFCMSCAATLAAGAIAGLYLRGIALEYRAGWQSTFLDAADVARVLHVVLAPGAWLTGIAIPGADHLRTIGGDSAGENAAPWIHLYAATILAARHRAEARTCRGLRWIARTTTRAAIPFRCATPVFPGLAARLAAGHGAHRGACVQLRDSERRMPKASCKLLTRAFQSTVEVGWLPVTAVRRRRSARESDRHRSTAVVAYSISARRPSARTTARFVRALASQLTGGAHRSIAIVDTSEFVARFGDPAAARHRARESVAARTAPPPASSRCSSQLARSGRRARRRRAGAALRRSRPHERNARRRSR